MMVDEGESAAALTSTNSSGIASLGGDTKVEATASEPTDLSPRMPSFSQRGERYTTMKAGKKSYQRGGGYNRKPAESHATGVSSAPLEISGSTLEPPVVRVSLSSPNLADAGTSERLMACHRYSRAVRVLAVLDAVVVLYGASAFTPLILMLWGPIAGYVSSTFQLRAAYAFLFYYGLRVSWDVGWLLSGGITWIVVWVFLVTDGAASGLVYVYLRLLRKCTPAEVEQLRDPDTPWQSGFFPLAVPVTPSTLTY